ncbi:hypothetical protein PENSPDRAFT_688828 [Peniophora sp. CONT]|nr:hypothetical protein PENSPDRAFT_688828 [Peniophora sp. CONT]
MNGLFAGFFVVLVAIAQARVIPLSSEEAEALDTPRADAKLSPDSSLTPVTGGSR